MGAAMFHAIISIGVLLAAFAIVKGYLHLTAVLFPLVLFPLLILTLGFAWILASLGVFLRDLGQTIGIITTILLFLSPVFYPSSALPEEYLNWLLLNPLTFFIEEARNVLIWGRTPDWALLGIAYLISLATAWLGFAWFQGTRKGFADVI
jgi:lipopolysaccharide transport system permease protein